MEASPFPAELRAAAPGLARGVAAILAALAALVARAFLRDPRRVALILPLWNRLNRTARRFSSLMARLGAATQPRPSARGGRSGPSPVRLPAAHAWLVVALRHEGAAYASQLQHLLAAPDCAALIAASPQAARLLRPLCHMLGIRPAALAVPPRQAAPRLRPPAAPGAIPGPVRQAPPPDAARIARGEVPPLRPLSETAPCEHVLWPWFPRKSAVRT